MSRVLLEQITGQSRAAGVRVVLEGADLPDRDVSTPIRQRIVRSQPPGSDTPVVHVLGPELSSFRITGTFNDAATGDLNGAIDSVRRLVQLCRDGYPVRLVWEFEGTNLWEYDGFITTAAPRWGQGSRLIGWEVEFEPMSATDATGALRPNRSQRRGPEDLNRQAAAALAIGAAIHEAHRTALLTRVAVVMATTRAT